MRKTKICVPYCAISIFANEASLKALSGAVPAYLFILMSLLPAGPGPVCVDCADPAHHADYIQISSIPRA